MPSARRSQNANLVDRAAASLVPHLRVALRRRSATKRRTLRTDTRCTGPGHPCARQTGYCAPPRIRKPPVYLGRVGGSVPSQTFLTNLSQRAEEVGQEQQLHSTTHPRTRSQVKVKIKVKVKNRLWCRSSKTCWLPRSLVREQQKGAGYPGLWSLSSRTYRSDPSVARRRGRITSSAMP
jgi:hypothetical protein